MEQKIFWGSDFDELLTYRDPNEAIEAYLDQVDLPFVELGELTMYEYKPMKAALPSCWSPLEIVLEALEEDYGNPDGNGPEVTDAMKEAEQEFLRAILEEYQPWMCEQTGKSVTVNALAWVREHRPDWLEDKSNARTH